MQIFIYPKFIRINYKKFPSMFALVFYINDKQFCKVPVGFIKRFNLNEYLVGNIYKVFWSRQVHSIQSESDEKCMLKLRNLQEPPPKDVWQLSQGEGYYPAHILRIEDSLDSLIKSIRLKRPAIPVTRCEEEFSSTEDEAAALQMHKENKKQEDVQTKKQEDAGKRRRALDIFKAAKKSRKEMFSELELENESDCQSSDEDPEVIPRRLFTELKESYDNLENEKDKAEKKIESLEKKILDYEKKYDIDEVVELRRLNRQLQEKILRLPATQGECSCARRNFSEIPVASDSEAMEVELGGGILINKNVYNELFNLDHIRKFTKSLAVAMWGTATLATRSVTGKPCKNRNGPKKVATSGVSQGSQPQQEPKPPLTPEKLAVISGQMREYLLKRGVTATEMEEAMKKRNRYISDKIQDICFNLAKTCDSTSTSSPLTRTSCTTLSITTPS